MPFVGPAERLLDQALTEAGIDPEEVYKTNVVKHWPGRPRTEVPGRQRPRAAERLARPSARSARTGLGPGDHAPLRHLAVA